MSINLQPDRAITAMDGEWSCYSQYSDYSTIVESKIITFSASKS